MGCSLQAWGEGRGSWAAVVGCCKELEAENKVKRPVSDSIKTFYLSCKSGFRLWYPDFNCTGCNNDVDLPQLINFLSSFSAP